MEPMESDEATQSAVAQLNETNLPISLKRMFEEALKEHSTPAAKKQKEGGILSTEV